MAQGQTGTFSNCWEANTTADPNWETEDFGTPSSPTGPSDDVSGGGIYAYMETSSSSTGDTGSLITPDIDLTGLTNPELTFYYHMFGADMGTLEVLVWNGSAWNVEDSLVGQQQNASTDPWKFRIVSLGSYSGTIKLKFRGTDGGTSFYSDMAIDEVSVAEAITCLPPSNLTASNVGTTTATVGWDSVANASNGYTVLYGAAGFNPASGGMSTTATADSVNLTGLSSATIYEAYVIADCGATDGISDTTGPVSFTTLCATYSSPYSTNFDSDPQDAPPLCWSDYETYSGSYVEVEDFRTANSGSQALYLYSSFGQPSDDLWAISPQFTDVTAGDKQIRFQMSVSDVVSGLIVGSVVHPDSINSFVAFDTITLTATSTYSEIIVPLDSANGYNRSHEYIVLAHNMGGTYDYVLIDDFNYEPIPACTQVTGAVLDSNTTTSMSISFATGNSTVDVEWGPVGFSQGTGCLATGVTATNSAFTIDNNTPSSCTAGSQLAASTTYDVYIRSNCTSSGAGTSVWSGPYQFSTACGVYSTPYTESFDNSTLPLCYSQSATTGGPWLVGNNATNSVNCSSAPDNTGNGGNYLWMDQSGGDDAVIFEMPAVDLTSLTNPYLEFYFFMCGAGYSPPNITVVEAWNGTSWVTFDSIQRATTGWEKAGKAITSAFTYNSGTNAQFRFRAESGGSGSDFYGDNAIDDISIVEAPACPDPGFPSLLANSITQTGATIVWTSPAPGSQVEWGPAGYSAGSGIGSVSVTDTFAILNSLSSGTNYDVYVRDSCGASDFSGWVGPVNFTTLCNVFSAPFVEDFESTSPSQLCWTNEYVSGTQDWSLGTGSTGGAITTAQSGTNNAVFTSSSAGGVTKYVSPAIDISALTTAQVSFYYGQEVWFGDQNELRVYARGVNSTNWVLLFSDDQNQASWTSDTALIPYTLGDTIVLAFEGEDNYGRGNVLDDIRVSAGPSCPSPVALSVSSIADTSATLTWNPTTGQGQAQYWFGPAGFYQGTQTTTGAKGFTSSSSVVVDTLTQNTCYEFLVRTACSAGDTSTWSGPYSFCTPCSPVSATYINNFDASTSLDPCWTAITDDPSASVGSSTFQSYNGTRSIRFYTWLGGATQYLVSAPLADLDSTKRVRFRAYDDDDIADFKVGTMSNPDDGSTFVPYDTIFGSEMEDDEWEEFRISFTNGVPAGHNFVAIMVDNGAFFEDLYIDNFIYDEPTCLDPSDFTFDGNTPTSVDLSWTTGGATDWNVEYGPVGFTPGTGTLISTTTSSPTISGLSSGQIFEFYVRDSCGPGDVSLWVGPITGYTSCSAPLSGTYTVGASGNYANFKEVAQALSICGVSGPVTFNVTTATYTGSMHLTGIPGVSKGIPGASATNTITINGNGATLEWDGQGPTATVILDSAQYVTIDSLTIANNYGDAHAGIYVTNNSDYFTLRNSRVYTDTSGGFSDLYNRPIIVAGDPNYQVSAFDSDVDHLTLTNNEIIGGYYALSIYGGFSAYSTNITITGNTIRNQYIYGAYLRYIDTLTVTENNMVSLVSTTDEDGLYMFDIDNFDISRNKIHVKDWAIYLNDGNDGNNPANRSTVTNNMVISDNDYGVYFFDVEDVDVYHNTFVGSPGMAINDDANLDFYNNIFVANGSDFAFESVDPIDATTLLDYNIYFNPGGGSFADDGNSTYSDLASWQTADASRNANSLEGNPVFQSSDDLHVIGGLANDVGDATLGVTVDIDGDTRPASGSTNPDIGADEYTPPPGDLALIEADFVKGLCLSTNDSIDVMVQSLVDSIDFGTDPLTINYNVVGPANSSGTATINSGAIGVLDSASLRIGGIDLSIPGLYTLDVSLATNTVNALTFNDTLVNITLEVDSEFVATPKMVTLASVNDSVEICIESPFFGSGDFFFSEISHFRSTGQGTIPPYFGADDYVEITGVPGSDLDGITLEQYNTSGLVNTYTFPTGTVIGPNGTAVIAVGQMNFSGPSTSDPSNYYYFGNQSTTWSSGTDAGRVLRNPDGSIMDAVGYDGYTFPASSGVGSDHWSGSVTGTSGTAGIRLTGPDNNTASNWTVVSSGTPQDVNVLNAGVPAPKPGNTGNLSWTYQGTQIDTNACTVVGPYSSPGTYVYVATFSNACGSYTDTVTVIAPTCSAPNADSLATYSINASSVAFVFDTTGTGATNFDVEFGPAGYTPGTGTMTTISSDSAVISGVTANLCSDFYVRTNCGASDSSIWVGPIQGCPTETICTDSIEQYAVTDIVGQSALFLGWYGGDGAGATVSTAQAASGTQSIYIPGNGSADIVAAFDTIDTGIWNLKWEMFVPSGTGAYYNVQRNYSYGSGTNIWAYDVNFLANGTGEVDGGSYGGASITTFSYPQGTWFTMENVIDLDNDTAYLRINGTAVGAGWQYSFNNLGAGVQFNAVNFYSNTLVGSNPDYYIDDFCVSTFVACPEPTNVMATTNIGCDSAEVSWNSFSGGSLIEYGPTGFTPGTGTFMTGIQTSPATITGLTAGTAYDVYVADTCTGDTSTYAMTTVTTASGPLPVATITATDLSGNGDNSQVEWDASASTNADTYSWDFGNGNSSSSVMDTANYGTNGSYTITLIVSNACGSDTATQTINVNVGLVENALGRSLQVFPNPASDEVNVSFKEVGSADVSIRIADAQGRAVMEISDKLQSGTYRRTINTSKLAAGVYMLTIESGDMTAVRRISIRQ